MTAHFRLLPACVTPRGRRRLAAWLALLAAAAAQADTVTNLNDSGAGSLRDAVASTAAGGTVDFAPGLTGIVTLVSGQIVIDKALTISGPGAQALTVVNGGGRVFQVAAGGAAVTIAGLRLTGSGLPAGENGGAIQNVSGALTLDGLHVVGSGVSADWRGGGIGGGVHSAWSPQGTSLTVRNSTFSANNAQKAGAIFAFQQPVTIDNSTLTGNSAADSGGAISLENSWNGSAIRHSTIVGNGANIGAGVYVRNSAFLELVNTVVAQNEDLNNGSPFLNDVDHGNNTVGATGSLFSEPNAADVVWNSTNTANLFGVADPLLAGLADNGGGTPTRLPQASSPLVDAADCVGLTPDQRGVARPQGPRCDIGAVERALAPPPAALAPVPTLSQWTLLLLSLGLGIAAWRRRA